MITENENDREMVAIGQLRKRLADSRASDAGEVNAAIDRAVQHFAEATIRTFVPLLVERRARDDLRTSAARQVQPMPPEPVPPPPDRTWG